MRLIFTCLFIVLTQFSYAQLFQPEDWLLAYPRLDTAFVKKHNIKSMQLVPEPTRVAADPSRTILHYDNAGNLVRMERVRQADTLMVHSFCYSPDKLLVWEMINDREWNREYKLVYRFNADGSLFQVKEYEMLKNGDALAVFNKQYVYEKENGNKPHSIRTYEGGTLMHTQVFTYDAKGRKTTETKVDPQGKQLGETRYTYNASGLLVQVLKSGNVQESFQFTYREDGKLLRTERYENKELRGFQSYEYDAKGLLLAVSRVVKTYSGEVARRQLVEYQAF